MTKKSVDSLISARWVVPVIPENTVLENHCLAIDQGNIIDLFPENELDSRGYQTANHERLDNHVLIPGLINCHGHAAMALLRGYADDLALQDWLDNHIWPAEGKWVGEQFVYDGTSLAIAEMLKSGTTCFSDMYFFPDQTARAAQKAQMRCQLTFPIFNFPSAYGEGPLDYIHKGLAIRDDYKNQQLVNVIFGPHAPYTVSDEAFEKIAMYANELDVGIHIHLHETAHEVAESIEQYGKRPIERLNALGILTSRTQCVHMANLNQQDIDIVNNAGSHVIHCPESNMKLASGFCPVHELQEQGINVAIGTDSAASNNDLDMFCEMKIAALLGKVVSGNPSAVNAHNSLRMATINGARALGLEDTIGSLESGKAADLCAINMGAVEAQPLYSPVSTLVYTNSGNRVEQVWVNGKMLVKDGELTTLNIEEIYQKALEWGQKIAGQVP